MSETILKKCSTCVHVKRFTKREDEPSDMGCNKLGWEGYTSEDRMACDGAFYYPKINQPHE